MSKRLDELVAKAEITEVLHRYCEAADGGDPALDAEVWHPDAIVRHGDFFHGPAREFMDWVRGRHAVNHSMAHYSLNAIIEVDGERARSRSYVVSVVHTEDDLVNVQSGRFVDTWLCVDGAWRIVERRFERDYLFTVPARDIAAR